MSSLTITAALAAPESTWQFVFRSVWASFGGERMDQEPKALLCWAALGLSLGVVGSPDDHGLDLLAFGRHTAERLERMGANPTAGLLAEALQLAMTGQVQATAAEIDAMPGPPEPSPAQPVQPGLPPEPPPGAPVEAIEAYHAALREHIARTRG